MKVGFGRGILTPHGKIAIAGTIPPRITDVVHDDVLAIAMVIQTENLRTIWVSCDMCHIPKKFTDDVILTLKNEIADFREEELILNATHATACAYVTDDEFLDEGLEFDTSLLLPLEETRKQMCGGIVNAVKTAISNLTDCTMEFAMADIITGYCRRVVYKDLSAVMYGNPYREDFLRMEYPDSSPSKLLYFYSKDEHKLIGIFADIPCPAQADEASAHITGDYWTVVRKRINEAFGYNVEVIAACACAGELAPKRVMYQAGGYNEKFEEGTISAIRLGEFIAENIIKECARPLKVYSDIELKHNRIAKVLSFPVRIPTEFDAQNMTEYFNNKDNFDDNGKPIGKVSYLKYVLIRKLLEEKPKFYDAKVSVMKIADILFYTAPMEVYTEYSKRIAMKFPNNPIFDVQITFDYMGYLPTKEAIEHGGYSTEIMSSITGDDGGELLVDEVSKLLNEIKGE